MRLTPAWPWRKQLAQFFVWRCSSARPPAHEALSALLRVTAVIRRCGRRESTALLQSQSLESTLRFQPSSEMAESRADRRLPDSRQATSRQADFCNPLEKIEELLTCPICLDRYKYVIFYSFIIVMYFVFLS